jgi:predicted RNA-binding protein YlqC (UPF0109 family)
MPDDLDLQIQNLLLRIAQAIVDYPGDVVIRSTIDGESRKFQISCNPTDIGRIIGKQGRTAQSIRTLITAMAMKYQRHYVLEMVEENGTRRRPDT